MATWATIRNLFGARNNLLVAWPPSYFKKTFVTVRLLGRNLYVVNSPQGVQHVMLTNSKNYTKSPTNTSALKPLLGDGLFVSEGALWTRQRKLAQPALHNKRIRGYAETMIKKGQKMLERWEAAGAGAELEMGAEMASVSAEIITQTMFGDDLGNRVETIFEAFQEYQEAQGRVHVSEMLFGLPQWFPRLSVWRGRRAVNKMDSVIYAIIEKRKESGEFRDDLLDMLLGAMIGEAQEPLPIRLIRDEVASIFLAGHETTAITLSWAFYLLEQHPEVEERLLSELSDVLGGRDPGYEDFPKLVYTRAVIEETMRLYPPVHAFSRINAEPDEIDGNPIPKKSFVVISTWLLHRHKKYWEAPNAFRPERFLPENADKITKHTYIPFGAGPRICLGKNFGIMESVLLLALVVQRYRLRLRVGHPVEPVGRLTLRPKAGLPMTLEPR